jgi:hypothetical protein
LLVSINQSIIEMSTFEETPVDDLTPEQVQQLDQENEQLAEQITRAEQAAAAQSAFQKNKDLKARLLALSSSKPASPRTEPVRTERRLNFTPITNGRIDEYKAAISRPRRQSIGFPSSLSAANDDDDVNSEDERDSELKVRIRPPEPFYGRDRPASGDAPAEAVHLVLYHFLDDLESYLNRECAMQGKRLSERQYFEIARQYVKGDAKGTVNDLIIAASEAAAAADGEPRQVTWADVRKALITRYGKQLSGHQLITNMCERAQKVDQTVDQLAVEFGRDLTELVRQNLASRDLAVAFFVKSLRFDIRLEVQKTINMTVDYFDKKEVSQSEPHAAIAIVKQLAIAHESAFAAEALARRKVPQQQTTAAAPASATATNSNSKTSTNKQSAHVIPDQLWLDRKQAGVCGKCGSDAHAHWKCTNKANTNPVSSTKRGGRANMMNAESVEVPASQPADQPKN